MRRLWSKVRRNIPFLRLFKKKNLWSFQVDINSPSGPFSRFSVKNQSTVAQRAETTVDEHSLTSCVWAHTFLPTPGLNRDSLITSDSQQEEHWYLRLQTQRRKTRAGQTARWLCRWPFSINSQAKMDYCEACTSCSNADNVSNSHGLKIKVPQKETARRSGWHGHFSPKSRRSWHTHFSPKSKQSWHRHFSPKSRQSWVWINYIDTVDYDPECTSFNFYIYFTPEYLSFMFHVC